jgi:hypothetical protein
VQLGELAAHVHAQLGVEVRQRLVHEERRRLAHHRAAERHALALATGQLCRAPVEQRLDLQLPRHGAHFALDVRHDAAAARREDPQQRQALGSESRDITSGSAMLPSTRMCGYSA